MSITQVNQQCLLHDRYVDLTAFPFTLFPHPSL